VQMTNYRDMMYTATFIGLSCCARPIAAAEARKKALTVIPAVAK